MKLKNIMKYTNIVKKTKWFASAWDIESQIFLKQYKSKVNKIASAMITNLKFLEHVAKREKNIYFNWYDIRTRYFKCCENF